MPVGRKTDYTLNGQGYMLMRQQGARSWQRSGKADTPDQRAFSEEQFGVLPSELERPVVWDDWSGGYGEAYRKLVRIGFHLAESNRYHWGFNFDSRFPRQLIHCQQPMQLITGTAANKLTSIYDALEVPPASGGQNQIWFMRNGGFTRVMPDISPSTYATWVADVELPSDRSGQAAVYGSYAYLAARNSGLLTRVQFNGSAVDMGVLAQGLVNAGDRLWKWHGPIGYEYYVQSLAGGDASLATSWSATLSISHNSFPILRATALKNTVYFGMPDGLYAGDLSGTFFNVLSELEGQASSENCRDLTIYRNEVVTPHLAGIYSYQPSTTTPIAREIGPVSHSNRSPVKGRIRAVKAYGQWLYAGLYDGSRSYLLAGRQHEDPNFGETMQWHVMNRFTAPSTIGRIVVDGITISSGGAYAMPARMYALLEASGNATPGGTAPVYFWPIPPSNDNPLGVPGPFSANYVGSASIYLGQVDFQAPSTPKVWRSFELTAENLASGYVYANVYYSVDGGARTLLGLVATSPKSTLFFPTGSGNWVSGQSIEISLDSFTTTQSLTPIYRTMVLRGALRPRSVDLITAVTRIADHMSDRQGTPMRSGATQISELRNLASSSFPVTLVDIAGATSIVNVLEPIEEHEIYQQGADAPELAAVVKMAVLSFTGG